jgi:hypothetical protein
MSYLSGIGRNRLPHQILQDRELFHVEENDTVASVVRRIS